MTPAEIASAAEVLRERVYQKSISDAELQAGVERLEAAKRANDRVALQDKIGALGRLLQSDPDALANGPVVGNNAVGQLLASEEFRDGLAGFRGERWQSSVHEVPYAKFAAAAGDPVLELTGDNADALGQTWINRLEAPGLRREGLTLAGLFSEQRVSEGATARYPIVTTRNDASGAPVTEGSDKPGAEFAFDDVVVELVKRAAFIPVSEEMMQDSPLIARYLQAQLALGVRHAEETAFAVTLYADATGTASAVDVGGDNGWDALVAGVTDVRLNYFGEPDAVFIHPTDWATLAVTKATTSGEYLRSPVDLPPMVVSQKATLGSPVVGAFRAGGTVYRRGGVRIDASNSHEDYFRKNLIAFRAEVRSALGITYPEAFSVVALGS